MNIEMKCSLTSTRLLYTLNISLVNHFYTAYAHMEEVKLIWKEIMNCKYYVQNVINKLGFQGGKGIQKLHNVQVINHGFLLQC